MNYRTLAFNILTLFFLAGCVNSSKHKELNDATENRQVKDSVQYKLPVLDTVKTTYPIQIGNDKALVTVHEIRRSKPDHFIIELDYRNEKVFSVNVDKQTLMDVDKTPVFLDTLFLDYTQRAALTAVKYEAIRGSTLYFEGIFEDAERQKAVKGRFNVFYNPSRKGQIYAWHSDTVHNIDSLK